MPNVAVASDAYATRNADIAIDIAIKGNWCGDSSSLKGGVLRERQSFSVGASREAAIQYDRLKGGLLGKGIMLDLSGEKRTILSPFTAAISFSI